MKAKVENLKAMLVFLGILAAVVAGITWGVWELMRAFISPTMARAWALMATVLLPLVGWGCYQIGLTESRGKLRGIDAGIGRVTEAAAQAIDLRATMAWKVPASKQEAMTVPLPELDDIFMVRPQLKSGDVIDL